MRLSPFGPIFGKELRTTARRKRTYWLRFLYLLALFLFMLLAYTSTSYRSDPSVSVAQHSREEAELGQVFFQTFAIFSVFAMPLIAPILTATAISAEKLGRTLDVLLMTPITSWQIVSGKLFSRLLVALTLLALSLPVLAVVRLLGGVDLDVMLQVLALCAATALAAAALGLFFSTFVNRAYAVILLSYITMGIFYAFVPFIMALSLSGTRSGRGRGKSSPDQWFFNFLGTTNPFFQVISKVMRGGMRGFGLPSYAWCVLFLLGVATLLVWAAGAILRRHAYRQANTTGEAARPAPTLSPDLTAETPTPFPSANSATGTPRDIGDNPVLWREIRRPLFTKRSHSIIGGVLTVALMGLTYIMLANQWTNELERPESHVGYGFIFCAVLTLLICVVSATAITSEKESDTWTLLLATPLGARAIIRGKAGGVLRRILWPSVLIIGHFFIFTACGIVSWTAFLLVLWVMFTFNCIWIVTGLYFSLRLKNNTFAVVANLLMPVAAYIAVPLILMILGNVLLDYKSQRAAEWTFIYIPYVFIVGAIGGLPGKSNWAWGSDTHRLWLPYSDGGVSPAEFVQAAIIVGLVYLVIAAILFELIIRRFNVLVGRAAQRSPLPAQDNKAHRSALATPH